MKNTRSMRVIEKKNEKGLLLQVAPERLRGGVSCHWWLSEKNENRQTAVLQLEEGSKKMVLRGFCASSVERQEIAVE